MGGRRKKDISDLKHKKRDFPASPAVKTLPSNAGGGDSIPGQGTEVPHATECDQKV